MAEQPNKAEQVLREKFRDFMRIARKEGTRLAPWKRDADAGELMGYVKEAGYVKLAVDDKLLTQEEGEAAVREWINEDYETRTVSLSRGHWECIVLVIAKAQLVNKVKAIPKLDDIAELLYSWDDKPFQDICHYEQAQQILDLINR